MGGLLIFFGTTQWYIRNDALYVLFIDYLDYLHIRAITSTIAVITYHVKISTLAAVNNLCSYLSRQQVVSTC